LSGHYTPGRFSTAGNPLPNGNAQAGLTLYTDVNRRIDNGALACVTCHTLPTGMGSDYRINGFSMQQIAPNPTTGNRHLMLISQDGSTNITLKVPQLRNLYDKVGMDLSHTTSRAGFGFTQDGATDTIERFVSQGVFDTASDQEAANLTAFMLAFAGSDLPQGGTAITNILNPLGPTGKDAHAAVGKQVTFTGQGQDQSLFNTLLSADTASTRIEMIAHVSNGAVVRGYLRTSGTNWQADAAGETTTQAALLGTAVKARKSRLRWSPMAQAHASRSIATATATTTMTNSSIAPIPRIPPASASVFAPKARVKAKAKAKVKVKVKVKARVKAKVKARERAKAKASRTANIR
jgi:hypothetical protein